MEEAPSAALENPVPQAHAQSRDLALIQKLPAAIYTCDAHGRITFYNEAAAILWGRTPETGKDLWCGSWKIYDHNGRPLPPDGFPMAVSIREGRPVTDIETIIERPDGTRLTILPDVQPLYDEQGKLYGGISMLVDITENKKKERQIVENETSFRLLSESLAKKVEDRTRSLRKSEERYYKMIEEVEDYAIVLLDKDGQILNWNKGAEKIKGYSEKDILGKNFSIFYLDSDRKSGLPQELINRARTEGKAMHEGWRLRKDGSKFWGYIVITALHDNSGNIIGFSKVTRDLTERKIAEDQIQHYTKDIEFQNKQLEEYAHITSHDLQEPLRKIHVFAGMIEDSPDDRELVDRNIAKIKSAASRMTILIKDILKYSKLSMSDDLLSAVDLNEVMENVSEDLNLLVEEKEAVLLYSGLPKVKGIPVQIHQLFFNLIANSLKFCSEKPVVEISSEEIRGNASALYPGLKQDIAYARLVFKDNGVGFEQQYADKVFKMFQRLGENISGTGIGLALCKKIVENHQGMITVSSEPNKGSIFTVFLPLAP